MYSVLPNLFEFPLWHRTPMRSMTVTSLWTSYNSCFQAFVWFLTLKLDLFFLSKTSKPCHLYDTLKTWSEKNIIITSPRNVIYSFFWLLHFYSSLKLIHTCRWYAQISFFLLFKKYIYQHISFPFDVIYHMLLSSSGILSNFLSFVPHDTTTTLRIDFSSIFFIPFQIIHACASCHTEIAWSYYAVVFQESNHFSLCSKTTHSFLNSALVSSIFSH